MDYKVEMKPLEWFSENPENYRAHPEEQLDVLQQSLERFGVFRNVVARPDGTILAGHGILRAAQRKGLTEFPTVVFEGSDAEARALMVADNEQSRLAQDDDNALMALLRSLDDVSATGYTEEEINIEALVDERELPNDDDSAEEYTQKTIVEKWLVALIVTDETHAKLQGVVREKQLPGEDSKKTISRLFDDFVDKYSVF